MWQVCTPYLPRAWPVLRRHSPSAEHNWVPAMALARLRKNTNASPVDYRKRNRHGPPYLALPSVKHGAMRHCSD